MSNLEKLGFNEAFLKQYNEIKSEDTYPVRIIAEFRGQFLLSNGSNELWGVVSGKLRKKLEEEENWPVVGDFVIVRGDSNSNVLILNVLKRKSLLKRRHVGSSSHLFQLMCSNIDICFIAMGLDKDYNPKRIERYIALVWDSGALPVVILTKADVCDDIDSKVLEIENYATGVEVIAISSITGYGMDKLEDIFSKGTSAAVIGSSGVGKSTFLNAIAKINLMDTSDIRLDDSKGRHTTTHRHMFFLENNRILIDTPGMRQVGLIDDSVGAIESSFDDIEYLIRQCRFNDCSHKNEPGCKILEAIEEGTLEIERFTRYRKLKLESKRIKSLAIAKKRRALKNINKKGANHLYTH